jgi:hypothetical protein
VLRLIQFVTVAALVLVGPTAGVAAAEGTVVCLPGGGLCTIEVDNPGTPGAPGSQPVADEPAAGPPQDPVCRGPLGNVIPCSNPQFGTWNPADGCYYRLADPQPPQTNSIWGGRTDGAIYQVMCSGVPGTGGGWVWLADPPPGVGGGGPSPAELAARAVEQLPLAAPAIGMTPTVGGREKLPGDGHEVARWRS